MHGWTLDTGENLGRSRPIVLIVVLTLHLSMLALLLANSRTLSITGSIEHPVELVYLPAQKAPTVRVENNPSRRLSIDIAMLPAPKLLTSSRTGSAFTWDAHGADADGQGSGVNWIAEAHRAVRA